MKEISLVLLKYASGIGEGKWGDLGLISQRWQRHKQGVGWRSAMKGLVSERTTIEGDSRLFLQGTGGMSYIGPGI